MRIGLHARNDTTFTETDYTVIRLARIKTLKVMDFTALPVLERVRNENPGIEFIVRLYDDRIGSGHKHPSPQEFAARFIPRINSLRHLATKFEIHNEPNHAHGIEGWGSSDWDAQDFRLWYQSVLNLLRAAAPWAHFGFPGLAPNYPHRDLEWLDICRDAVLASDWLGCHTYWQYGNIFSTDWGTRYVHYRARFPDKTIEITEFGNSTPNLSHNDMASQYVAYYTHLQRIPYIGSASSFICSSPDPTWLPFAWCDPPQIFPVAQAVGGIPHVPAPPTPVYRVSYLSHNTPLTLAPGQQVTVSLRLRNDGNTIWRTGGNNPVRLAYRWWQGQQLAGGWPDLRTALPRDVAAGESVLLDARLGAPAAAGSYTLTWDLIEEGVGWFKDRGAAPLSVAVRVQQVGAPIGQWRASASHNTEEAALAVDGTSATVWTSKQTQQPGMWFQIDLGRVQAVSGMQMASPDKDFPRGYYIEVSIDGDVWMEVARKDPNWRSLDATFPTVRARYLRITQTRVPRWPVPWSISNTVVNAVSLWEATADPNPQDAAKAIDGDPTTAWSTITPQQPGSWFQLDLGEKMYVNRLRLDNTANPQYPRGYVIRTSVDGQTWDEAARSASNWAPLNVALGPRWARWIRIENIRGSPWHPWTIAEVSVETAPSTQG